MTQRPAILLVCSVIALVSLGIIMLWSTSTFADESARSPRPQPDPAAHATPPAPHASPDPSGPARATAFEARSRQDPLRFVKRQLAWLAGAAFAAFVVSRIDYHLWQRLAPLLLVTSAALLACCFFPGIGMRINGSNRWLNLQVANVQPSEFAKIAIVAFLAWWFCRHEKSAHRLLEGFLCPGLLVALPLLLIAAEIDLGTTALLAATTMALMFVAGTRLRWLALAALLGSAALAAAAWTMPDRVGRILCVWKPESFPADFYQQLQGLIALGSGGVEGLGLGNGRQKLAYLPYAHTDFILPMIGEELGLRFTLGVLAAYAVIICCGTVIAARSPDRYGLLLGFGLVSLLAVQAIVNVGVTTAVLPNKGLPLPFISYGGSNLAMCLLGIGILLNIHRQTVNQPKPRPNLARLSARTTPRI